MAKLTPLAKGLVTLVILGGTAAAAWHLGLRELVQGTPAAGDGTAATTPGSTTPGSTPAASTPSTPAASTPANRPAAGGALGSPGNPVKVSIVSFHGYAP